MQRAHEHTTAHAAAQQKTIRGAEAEEEERGRGLAAKKLGSCRDWGRRSSGSGYNYMMCCGKRARYGMA
jgi:hypothetical protein